MHGYVPPVFALLLQIRYACRQSWFTLSLNVSSYWHIFKLISALECKAICRLPLQAHSSCVCVISATQVQSTKVPSSLQLQSFDIFDIMCCYRCHLLGVSVIELGKSYFWQQFFCYPHWLQSCWPVMMCSAWLCTSHFPAQVSSSIRRVWFSSTAQSHHFLYKFVSVKGLAVVTLSACVKPEWLTLTAIFLMKLLANWIPQCDNATSVLRVL